MAIDSQSLTHNARCGCLKTQLGRGLFALLNIWVFFYLKWHITVEEWDLLKVGEDVLFFFASPAPSTLHGSFSEYPMI